MIPVVFASVSELFSRRFLGQELWRLLATLAFLCAAFLASRLVKGIIERWGKKLFSKLGEEPAERAAEAFGKPVRFALAMVGVYLAVITLSVPDKLDAVIQKALAVLVIIVVAYGLYRLVDFLDAFLGTVVARTETKLDDMLLPILRKSLKVMVVMLAAIMALQKLDFNVGAILATLGIGGLAIALAGKDTIANVFGSIMIFADQPFKIGDRINVGGYDGPVEEVGLRSTKIRTLDGHLVSIPNSVVANEMIENIGKRPTIKRLFKIGVTYGTGYGKMKRAIEIIKEILDEMEGLEELKIVRFFEFADFSLNILVIFWVSQPDYLGKFLPINEEINLEILRRFDEEGIEIAFPTRTVHMIDETPREVNR